MNFQSIVDLNKLLLLQQLAFSWVWFLDGLQKTGSIRYVKIAHIITDLMGLAGLAFVGLGY